MKEILCFVDLVSFFFLQSKSWIVYIIELSVLLTLMVSLSLLVEVCMLAYLNTWHPFVDGWLFAVTAVGGLLWLR